LQLVSTKLKHQATLHIVECCIINSYARVCFNKKMGVQRRALLQFTISETFLSQFIFDGLNWLVLYETYCLTKSHDWRHGEEWGWTKRGGMWGRGSCQSQ
jgi:hypothetical protein